MIINGEELYEAWKKWIDSEDTKKIPFVIQSENFWGEERHMLVRRMEPMSHDPSTYELKLFNHKFRPITLFANKDHEFEAIEDGRYKSINWR